MAGRKQSAKNKNASQRRNKGESNIQKMGDKSGPRPARKMRNPVENEVAPSYQPESGTEREDEATELMDRRRTPRDEDI